MKQDFREYIILTVFGLLVRKNSFVLISPAGEEVRGL